MPMRHPRARQFSSKEAFAVDHFLLGTKARTGASPIRRCSHWTCSSGHGWQFPDAPAQWRSALNFCGDTFGCEGTASISTVDRDGPCGSKGTAQAVVGLSDRRRSPTAARSCWRRLEARSNAIRLSSTQPGAARRVNGPFDQPDAYGEQKRNFFLLQATSSSGKRTAMGNAGGDGRGIHFTRQKGGLMFGKAPRTIHPSWSIDLGLLIGLARDGGGCLIPCRPLIGSCSDRPPARC